MKGRERRQMQRQMCYLLMIMGQTRAETAGCSLLEGGKRSRVITFMRPGQATLLKS